MLKLIPKHLNGQHIVKSGDTFSGIAKKYGTTLQALEQLNPLVKNIDRLSIGDTVYYLPLNKITQVKTVDGIKSPTNSVDLTPVNMGRFNTIVNHNGSLLKVDNRLLTNLDNYLISKNVGLPLRQAILYSVVQEGSTTGPHGNGAYGYLGWRGDRIPGKGVNLMLYLYDTVFGTFNANHWNDGGVGSGYKTGRAALQSFINAKTVQDALRALNYGYVRPDLSVSKFRSANGASYFLSGGNLNLIPKALEGIQFPVILQSAVADNTRYVRPYTSIEIAKSKKAYEQEQLQKLIEAAQERLPLLKADTRSTEQRQRDHNRAIQLEVKQKANELAANFGRALGANHDMTVDEVNDNTLNTANLVGYMAAPYLMTALESSYYGATGRPKEAAITAGVGFGLPIIFKGMQQLPNIARSYAVSRELKRGIKQATKLDETIGVPGQIGWAPKQTFTGYHASNEKTFKPNFWYENWAKTTHNAPYGVYIAEGTAPTKGFLAKRPYVHNVTVELEKPMVQIGELLTNTKNSTRNGLERFAQKQGADAIIFQDIKDNQMNHQNILKTLNPDTQLIINNKASTVLGPNGYVRDGSN